MLIYKTDRFLPPLLLLLLLYPLTLVYVRVCMCRLCVRAYVPGVQLNQRVCVRVTLSLFVFSLSHSPPIHYKPVYTYIKNITIVDITLSSDLLRSTDDGVTSSSRVVLHGVPSSRAVRHVNLKREDPKPAVAVSYILPTSVRPDDLVQRRTFLPVRWDVLPTTISITSAET